MSSIGNIKLSYGKQFNIAIANTYSNIVLSGSNLPANTIIISSNVDNEFNDTGSYSMIATDNDGNPVRLTYCIKQGNGLNVSEDNKDVLILNIDNDSIKNTSVGLHIDLSSISENTIHQVDNKLTVNNDIINIASKLSRGIFKIDSKTILLDDVLYVNTDKLNYSNNDTKTYGILKSSDDILTINNGVISINENNIPKASDKEYGIAKADENTITIDDNYLTVNTSHLMRADEENYGVISVDNNKIKVSEGILSVDTENLNKASVSIKGILSVDGKSINVNSGNQISVNNYSNMLNDLESLIGDLNNETESLNTIKEHILSQIK